MIGAAAFGGNGGKGLVVAALADTRAPLAELATAADGEDLTSFSVVVGVVGDVSVESESNSSRIEFNANSSSSS